MLSNDSIKQEGSLLHACFIEDLNLVQAILSNKRSSNSYQNYLAAIFLAWDTRNLPIFKFICNHLQTKTISDKYIKLLKRILKQIIVDLSIAESVDFIGFVLEKSNGMLADAVINYNRNLLYYAIALYHVNNRLLPVLLDFKVDLNKKNYKGYTAIFWLLIENFNLPQAKEILKLILYQGAEINALDNRGLNVLSHIAKSQRRSINVPEDLIDLLIAYGAQLAISPLKYRVELFTGQSIIEENVIYFYSGENHELKYLFLTINQDLATETINNFFVYNLNNYNLNEYWNSMIVLPNNNKIRLKRSIYNHIAIKTRQFHKNFSYEYGHISNCYANYFQKEIEKTYLKKVQTVLLLFEQYKQKNDKIIIPEQNNKILATIFEFVSTPNFVKKVKF